MSNEVYPEDEFDRVGRTLPKGAHRPGQPWWRGVLPFIIVIVVAPLLGWAMFLLIGSHSDSVPKAADSSETKPAQSAPAAPKVSEVPSEETPASPVPEQSPSQSPSASAAQPNLATKVTVSNAAGITGLAAQVKAKVSGAGFTSVSAGNYVGTKPAQNTIYYTKGHEAEAKKLQQVLKIDMLVPRSGLSTDVVVVLTSRLG